MIKLLNLILTKSYKRAHQNKKDTMYEILNNIRKYLNKEIDFVTYQSLVGFNLLFQGFVIKN